MWRWIYRILINGTYIKTCIKNIYKEVIYCEGLYISILWEPGDEYKNMYIECLYKVCIKEMIYYKNTI